MKKAMKSRRGMTVAEIVVALALVSIMITMVVSFTALITGRTKANQAADAMRADCDKVQAAVKGWLDGVNLAGAEVTFFPEEGKQTASALTATVGAGEDAQTYTLKHSYAALSGNLPEEKTITIRTETVKAVEFEVMKNGSDYLVFCYLTCENPETKETVNYTFCINPRVGETV